MGHEQIQFQIDFSTADIERGSCVVPMTPSVTVLFPTLMMPLGVYLPAVEIEAPLAQEMKEGYQTMASENKRLAEEALPLTLEVWPTWEA